MLLSFHHKNRSIATQIARVDPGRPWRRNALFIETTSWCRLELSYERMIAQAFIIPDIEFGLDIEVGSRWPESTQRRRRLECREHDRMSSLSTRTQHGDERMQYSLMSTKVS
jgi:hypothetical protein